MSAATTEGSEAATAVEHPLFPLRAVLFPDGLLELKIFEARYLDMISRCLRERTPFAVVALKSGGEIRAADGVELHDTGTLAELIEVDAEQAGILRVRAHGTQRLALEQTRLQGDGLWLGRGREIAGDDIVAPGPEHERIVGGLVQAVEALAAHGVSPFLEPLRYDSAGWVANRWCEVLPFPVEARQRLLVMSDPQMRLAVIDTFLAERAIDP